MFESDTVKSEFPMQEHYEIFKDLTQTVGLLYWYYCLKKALKMIKSSENDQSTGHFQSFFFIPSTLNLKKNSR